MLYIYRNKIYAPLNENFHPPKKSLKTDSIERNSKNVNYELEIDRLNSFKGYSNANTISTALMARTGLFYDAVKKQVKCYFCKYILQNFKSNDDFVRLHYKYSRSCPLMTRRRTANVPINLIELDLALPPLIYDECGTGHRYTNASAIYREVKYPQFAKIDERKESYKDWPLQMKQKPEVLAESGLFYTKEGDKVKCYDCGLGLKDWAEDDNPWIEHVKYSKNCHYVNFVKGRDFVELVKNGKSAEMKDDRNEEQLQMLHSNNHCKSCNKGLAEVTFLPCNHTALCAICAINRNECIDCKRTVECRLRLYYH